MGRCQTIIEGGDIMVYRHSEGEPDIVLPKLLPLLREFMKYRGWDPFYMAAQITWLYKQELYDCVRRSIRWNKKHNYPTKPNAYDSIKYHGVGIRPFTGRFHSDEAFIYVVRKAGYLEVRATMEAFWNEPVLANTKIVKCVRFDGKMIKPPKEPVAATRTPRTSREVLV